MKLKRKIERKNNKTIKITTNIKEISKKVSIELEESEQREVLNK